VFKTLSSPNLSLDANSRGLGRLAMLFVHQAGVFLASHTVITSPSSLVILSVANNLVTLRRAL